MASYVGCLEADLQASAEYSAGGVGPFLRQARSQGPYELPELLTRSAAALKRLGIVTALNLFVDEDEIYVADDDATGDTLEAVLDAARRADLEGTIAFYLKLAYLDKNFVHTITVEASVDHPADEAALTVLDIATPLEDADEELVGDVDESKDYEENLDNIELLEDLLGRVQDAFDRELALTEPEIDVWIDWEGAYTGLGYSGPFPGLPGLQ